MALETLLYFFPAWLHVLEFEKQTALAQLKANLLVQGQLLQVFQVSYTLPCHKMDNNFYCPENGIVFWLFNLRSDQQVLILVWGLFHTILSVLSI